jgi:hypothetical protein
MAPVAIYDSRVRIGYAAKPETNPKRQRKLLKNARKFRHQKPL